MSMPKMPGVAVIQEFSNPDRFPNDEAIQAHNAGRLQDFVTKYVRKQLQKFVGRPNNDELRGATRTILVQTVRQLEDMGVIHPDEHDVAVRGDSWADCQARGSLGPPDPSLMHISIKDKKRPPEPKKEEPTSGYKTHEESNMSNIFSNRHYIEQIYVETGIARERMCVECLARAGRTDQPGGLAVDVLNGTEDERWAASAALKKLVPVGTRVMVHARETADHKVCSVCKSRLKIEEQYNRKTRSITAKSRCSNPMCSNGKHWMPAYRPTSTKPLSPAMALTVDRGDDEPSDWGTKPKLKTWAFNPPDKITSPVFKNPPPPEDLDIRKAICSDPLTWQPVERDRVRSKVTPTVAIVESVGGRGVGSEEPFYVLQVEWSREFPVGHIFSVKHGDMMSCWEPLRGPNEITDEEVQRRLESPFCKPEQWQPQLNQWIRPRKGVYRSGCINFRQEHQTLGVQWGVRFTDADYPVLLTTEELVANCEPDAVSAIMNPPASKPLDVTEVKRLNAAEREDLRNRQMAYYQGMLDNNKVSSEFLMKQAGLKESRRYDELAHEYNLAVDKEITKLSTGLALGGNFVDGNYLVKSASAYGKVMSPELMKKLKEAAKKLSPIGTCTGRLSSSQPNQAAFPRQEHVYTEEMLVKNREGVCGRLRRVEGGYWQVQDIRLSTVQLPSGDDRTELMNATEIVLKGWKPCVLEDEPNQNQDVFKQEYLGEFLPALPAWPAHLDNSWVGRQLVHRESGERVTLGHYAVGIWNVHVPCQGTWRFTEQDIFKLFAPAPPVQDELSSMAYSTVKHRDKPHDIHQKLANYLGVTREEAKVRNFALLYGQSGYPKKDPKQG